MDIGLVVVLVLGVAGLAFLSMLAHNSVQRSEEAARKRAILDKYRGTPAPESNVEESAGAPVQAATSQPPAVAGRTFEVVAIVCGVLAVFVGGVIKAALVVVCVVAGTVAFSLGAKQKAALGLVMAGSALALVVAF